MSQRVPMLNRWLDEGMVKSADKKGHRNVYARGAKGMNEYLKDWDTTWAGLAKKAEDRKQS